MKIKNIALQESQKHNKKHSQNQTSSESRICRYSLCCNNKPRLSISSSSSVDSDKNSTFSDREGSSLSSLTHYMVQEKLEQMIIESQKTRRRRKRSMSNTKFIVMMAMEKCSYDPRQDFRDSMVEMIVGNKIKDVDELRTLLDYYLSMNPSEYRSAILEIFYEVCADLFLCS